MSLHLSSDATDTISLADFVDHLEHDIGLVDVDGLVEAAPAFKRLLNNRRVLTDFIDAELKDWRAERDDHEYTGHTLVLERRPHFMIRANVWPTPDPARPMPTADDPGFGYLTPHDHNFAFLTGGYHGPGYTTVLYEYDVESVVGTPGEHVELTPRGRSAFPLGTMMLYRPSRDVHYQEHPAALSISLNVLVSGRYTERDQFLFDVPSGTITTALIAGNARTTTLCDLAAELGDGETAEVLDDVARRGRDARSRVAAAAALRGIPGGDGGTLLEELCASSDYRVRELAGLARATQRATG